MIDKKSLLHLKSATVGIGVISLANPLRPELEVYGSGFFVSSDAWVMTATHVARQCIRRVQQYMANKIDTNLIATQMIFYGDGKFQVTNIPMESPIELNLNPAEKSSIDLDICLLRPKDKKQQNKPFLKIKKTSSVELFEDIVMCGFPSGKHSLNIGEDLLTQVRLSPVIQFGKVSGLIPFDNAEYPFAIQTDIVGTGGSSGSPIVKVDNSEVIAVAQKVLPAGVGGKALFIPKDKPQEPLEGEIGAISNIGLTYGISHNMLDGCVEGMKKELETGIPFKDYPKFTYAGKGEWGRG